jgi:hypothetical protein
VKLIGLILHRGEEWVLPACLDVARRWCDDLVIRDGTPKNGVWAEMDERQAMLDQGRDLGGTHFAMIDADEMLTHNLLPVIRPMVAKLTASQVLDLPMINPHRGLEVHRDDHTEHSQSQLSVAFCDSPNLTWQPRNGYHFHQRCPQGSTGHLNPLHRKKDNGGAFHLQWVCWDRVVSKHQWYALNERIRWPEKYSVQDVNRIYSAALDERGLRCRPIPAEWWGDYPKHLIDANHVPWHKADVERMAKEHPEALEGLSIAGWPNATV